MELLRKKPVHVFIPNTRRKLQISFLYTKLELLEESMKFAIKQAKLVAKRFNIKVLCDFGNSKLSASGMEMK